MTLQSQLGTSNSVLASEMALGVPAGASTAIVKSLSSNLALTSSAHGFLDTQTVSSALTLNQAVTEIVSNPRQTVTSTLNLSDSAVGARVLTVAASSTLGLTSLGGRTRTASVNSSLSLTSTQLTSFLFGDREPAGNTLSLTQSATVGGHSNPASTLNLSHSVTYHYPTYVYPSNLLTVSQHTSTPYHMWAETAIGFSDMARVPITYSFTSTLNFTHLASMTDTISTLNLVQTVGFGFGYGAYNTLGLTQNLVMTGIYQRQVEHDDILDQSLTWFENTACMRKRYAPFQGEGAEVSDSLFDPQGDLSDRLSLYTPAVGLKTSEVILRAPELDNRDRSAYNRVSRETLGGRIVVYADSMWPKVRTLALTIIGLKRTQVDELQTFIMSTVGQEIGLTDWEGRMWKGYITNPDESATQDGRKSWTVIIEFEGELLEVQQPPSSDGQEMTLTQSVSAVIV